MTHGTATLLRKAVETREAHMRLVASGVSHDDWPDGTVDELLVRMEAALAQARASLKKGPIRFNPKERRFDSGRELEAALGVARKEVDKLRREISQGDLQEKLAALEAEAAAFSIFEPADRDCI